MADFGVFDIIGPRMIGPSSSHTAGAARLGYIAWKIANRNVAAVELTLFGSFAQTGRGHGTDKALIAGVLGMQPDDERLAHAPDIARQQGIAVQVEFSSDEMEWPNTARIRITSADGQVTEVIGASIGGGNILITQVNGNPVEFSGDYPTLLIRHHDMPGVITEITRILAGNSINVAFMQVFRHGRGAEANMVIETDQPVSEEVQEDILRLCPGVRAVRMV